MRSRAGPALLSLIQPCPHQELRRLGQSSHQPRVTTRTGLHPCCRLLTVSMSRWCRCAVECYWGTQYLLLLPVIVASHLQLLGVWWLLRRTRKVRRLPRHLLRRQTGCLM